MLKKNLIDMGNLRNFNLLCEKQEKSQIPELIAEFA
jgi:hypothetical protein